MPRPTPARQLLHAALLVAGLTSAAAAQTDLFEFFEEEARTLAISTASRTPHAADEAPATMHVVTRDDLDAYGAFHIWDALRGIPGVDVFSARAADGVVSIRGLARVNNNRTLVLLNGRRALDGYDESLNWESLPVALDEIERIEIVEGPASALYGGNAIGGVINIITLPPDRGAGTQVSVTGGTRGTVRISGLHAAAVGRLAASANAEFSSSDRYDEPEHGASDVLRGGGALRYVGAGGTVLSLAAGGADLRTELSEGGLGTTREDGRRAFVRADAARGRHRLQGSWAGGSTRLQSFGDRSESHLDYGTVELELESGFDVFATELVVGGQLRREDLDAAFARATHDLWAVYAEHRLDRGRVRLWTSARADHHPHAGTEISPRMTAVLDGGEHHTLRVSAGTAFRHPTLLENHIDLRTPVDVRDLDPAGAVDTVAVAVLGNTGFRPEHLVFGELAHAGRFGRLRTRAALFAYELRDVYVARDLVITLPRPRVVGVEVGYENGGTTRAWGGESAVDVRLGRGLTASLAYSHQRLSGTLDDQATSRGTPNDKLSVRTRYRRAGWVADAALHRVGTTTWASNSLTPEVAPRVDLAGYWILDVSLRRRLGGVLDGCEVQLLGANLLGAHAQVLPQQGTLAAGQAGERIGSRGAVRLVWRP